MHELRVLNPCVLPAATGNRRVGPFPKRWGGTPWVRAHEMARSAYGADQATGQPSPGENRPTAPHFASPHAGGRIPKGFCLPTDRRVAQRREHDSRNDPTAGNA